MKTLLLGLMLALAGAGCSGELPRSEAERPSHLPVPRGL